jgi:hypothetical protein
MKTALYLFVVITFCILPVRADLTIVYSTAVEPARQAQKPEAASNTAAAAENMTIKIKGDKARIDAPPHMTAIFDGTTDELVNLLNDQKTVVRISPEKMRAIADMLNKFGNNKAAPQKPKLTSTGQKEVINGYDTEQYTYDGPDFKATYWIAPNYPNGAAILAQLQSIKSEMWDAANTKMPDFRDFPGLPIQMRIIVGGKNEAGEPSGKENQPRTHAKASQAASHHTSPSGHPTEIASTITAVSLDSIPDSEFRVPTDFKETKLPDIFNKNAAPSVSPNP